MRALRNHQARGGLYLVVCLLATIQCVWFYLSRVPSCLDLAAFEQGKERTPFQYRVLLMLPLRWAHESLWFQGLAARLTAMHGWFSTRVDPETLLEAPLDLACILITGLMTARLYRKSSRSAILEPFIFPLTLCMIAGTYCLLTIRPLRFVYDLPNLALFSIGAVLIYERKHSLYFAVLFVVTTLNRETSLLLLVFFMLAECGRHGAIWRSLFSTRVLGVLLPLALFWVAWHLYISRLYGANRSENHTRLWLNIGTMAIPLAWPQIAGACGYLWPFVLAMRSRIQDPVLRTWLWALPVWFAFMLYYGLFVEIRVFGELIPYFACAAALIFEEVLISRFAGLLQQTSLLPAFSENHAAD